MKVIFKPSFRRDLRSIRDQTLSDRIARAVEQVEAAPDTGAISQIIKMQGFARLYRIRVGDHRLGVDIEGDTVTFWRCLPRDQIYSQFP